MGKQKNNMTGRNGLYDKLSQEVSRSNKNNRRKPTLSPAQRHMRKLNRILLGIVSPAAILWIASTVTPVDEIMLQDDVKGADTMKLVTGFNTRSAELSMKYPGKTAWILTQDGQQIYQSTTVSIPVKGAYHAGFTHLNCNAEDYITHYKKHILSLGSARLEFNCQLGEEPNSIPG